MKLTDLNKKTGRVCMILIPLLILLATVDVLFLSSDDISRAQVEKQHVFGATYMTMNNPYHKVVDSQIRAFLEENGDVLLTRDGTMNQQRQNEEIKELIESGAEVIFITCVDWDQVEEGIRYANEAGVPVIAIDTEVKNSDLVTCSVVSNNYHAGVLCAEHLLANHDFTDREDFETFYSELAATRNMGANFRTPLFPTFGSDRVLTLSTCYRPNNQMRFLVMGRLVADIPAKP